MAPLCLSTIPEELAATIVQYTSMSSLSSLALVSKRFTSLAVPRLHKRVFYGKLARFTIPRPHFSYSLSMKFQEMMIEVKYPVIIENNKAVLLTND